MSVTELPIGIPARTRRRDAAAHARPASAEFRALLVVHVADLYAWARQLTRQRADANDLVQETYRRALERHQQFLPGTDLRAWLGSILRNLHRDRMRRAWREVSRDDAVERLAAAETQPGPRWTRVSDEDLAGAVQSLAPVYRTLYLLHTVDGRSYKDISRDVGIPCGTVGARLFRARHMLRKFLLERLRDELLGDEEGD